MANVLFKRGNTATINSTAIADGQLLWNTVTGEMWEDVGTSRIACGKLVDTSLNPISPNAVSNQAITGSIINTRAEALAITADYIPCGTKPLKELNTIVSNLITEITPVILWTNPAPTSSFAGQTISNLSETIANFSEYEIIYELDTNPTSVVAISTGRIKTSYKTGLNFASTTIVNRFVTSPPSGTSITFGNGSLITLSTGASVTDNTRCIPLIIKGHR